MASFNWSSLGGALLGYAGASSANALSAESVQKQIDFQREVLQNRYQWTVEDLRAAGINPTLAVSGLSGGSASGASYNAQNVGASAVNSAASLAQVDVANRQQANNDMLSRSQVDVNSANANRQMQESANAEAQRLAGYYQAQVGMLESSAHANQQSVRNMQAQIPAVVQGIAESRARVQESEARLKNLRSERDEILSRVYLNRQQVYESRSRMAEQQSRIGLNAAYRDLSHTESMLNRVRKDNLFWQQMLDRTRIDSMALDYRIREAGELPYAQFERDYWTTPFNRFIESNPIMRRTRFGGFFGISNRR